MKHENERIETNVISLMLALQNIDSIHAVAIPNVWKIITVDLLPGDSCFFN